MCACMQYRMCMLRPLVLVHTVTGRSDQDQTPHVGLLPARGSLHEAIGVTSAAPRLLSVDASFAEIHFDQSLVLSSCECDAATGVDDRASSRRLPVATAADELQGARSCRRS
jgi:hypothetical protein